MMKRYKFFRDNAGYIVGQRAKGALDLARAEIIKDRLLDSGELEINWMPDYDDRGPVDWGWSESDIEHWNRRAHHCEGVTLELHGEHIASLWAIWDADSDYRRVIEAELMLEALPVTPLGLRMLAR